MTDLREEEFNAERYCGLCGNPIDEFGNCMLCDVECAEFEDWWNHLEEVQDDL